MVVRFDDPAAFYGRAESFLARREAHNNLLLGICAGLIRHPEGFESPYVALVEEQGAVVLAAVRTPPHNLVLSASDRPDTLERIARDAYDLYGELPGVLAPTPLSERFAEHWHQLTGCGYSIGRAERIYQLERVVPVSGVPGVLRKATVDDRDLLVEWIVAFSDEAGEPANFVSAERSVDSRLDSTTSGIYVWEDGEPVSLIGYTGPTPNGIRIGPVYTPPERRRRGYASAGVAEVSQIMLDSGRRYCFLFTDLANPTSNHIYQQIGYRPVCDADEYRFDTGGI